MRKDWGKIWKGASNARKELEREVIVVVFCARKQICVFVMLAPPITCQFDHRLHRDALPPVYRLARRRHPTLACLLVADRPIQNSHTVPPDYQVHLLVEHRPRTAFRGCLP
jgi:hypothetical protein